MLILIQGSQKKIKRTKRELNVGVRFVAAPQKRVSIYLKKIERINVNCKLVAMVQFVKIDP